MSITGFQLPFAACVSCMKYNNCPVHMPGVRGNVKVKNTNRCVLDQLQPSDLAKLSDQITNHLGILECEKEALGRKLDTVLNFMERFDKKVIIG